ncbi:MAG TPA: CPBP family intramembrane metalloprotease [Pyrinomonadaceae bacterium]|nr:CPBP family intramembrane metalloprotease [Pyrinomonadaceae bacterium]
MDAFKLSLMLAAIGLVLALLAKIADKRILVTSAVLFAVYLGLDDFVTGLPNLAKALDVIPGNWNWTGKVFSLVLSAIVIYALKLSLDAVGLRKQENSKITWIAVGFFIIWGTCLGLLFKPGAPDAETLAFQATMPGLAEEIAFRGIAPAILLGLMGRKPHVDGIPWAVILATSVLFGIWHSLSVSGGQVGFDLMSGLFPFIGSIPGGWLRFKTKSLLAPILIHSIANVAFHLAGWLTS